MPSKELTIPSKHFFSIQFEGFKTLQYYEDEVKRLNETIEDYKEIMKDVYDKRDYTDELRKWKYEHSLECIIITNRYRISPFHCGDMIRKKRCTFHKDCIPRKEFIERIFNE
jgi:hypothetical protein